MASKKSCRGVSIARAPLWDAGPPPRLESEPLFDKVGAKRRTQAVQICKTARLIPEGVCLPGAPTRKGDFSLPHAKSPKRVTTTLYVTRYTSGPEIR
jgi:hypothetical protein